jgi:hypothetical protein
MGWFDALDPLKLVSSGKGMFDSFLHPERGYEEAERQARKYYEDAQKYQMPYQQHGLEAYGPLNEAYGKLLHPEQLAEEWSKSYSASPESKRMQDMFRNQGMEEASRMGLMGSSGAMANLQQGVGDISLADRRNYLNDLMQKYMAGVGLGQNIYGTGANAAGSLGGRAFDQGGRMAALGYGRVNAPGDVFGGLLGTGAKLYSNYLTGGMNTGAQGGMR